MTFLQPGSEFYVSKSRENTGPNAKLVTELRGPFVNFGTRDALYQNASLEMTSDSLSSGFAKRGSAPSDVRLPEWCYPAFKLERARYRTERTDWGFVAPVWIAIALFCTLVQVVGIKALLALF